MSERLFCVVDHAGNIQSDNGKEYFTSKMVAKGFRTECERKFKADFYIAKGPDHIGNHGHRLPKRKNK